MRLILYCLAIISAAQVGSGTSTPSPLATQGCPIVSVDCPLQASEPGVPVTFTAEVSGVDQKVTLTYNWSVSAGTLISGQGTSTIIVDKAGTEEQSIIVAVEVGGLDSHCPKSASCTISAPALRPMSRKFDEYGDIAFKDEIVRLKGFARQLQNEPGVQGYILAYGGRDGDGQTRADRARDYLINKHSINPERIVTVKGGFSEKPQVELWIVPTGGRPPRPPDWDL